MLVHPSIPGVYRKIDTADADDILFGWSYWIGEPVICLACGKRTTRWATGCFHDAPRVPADSYSFCRYCIEGYRSVKTQCPHCKRGLRYFRAPEEMAAVSDKLAEAHDARLAAEDVAYEQQLEEEAAHLEAEEQAAASRTLYFPGSQTI